ncbi:hypothetical protein WJX79_008610 [Trebouxia sp. C0005]
MLRLSVHVCRPSRIVTAYEGPRALVPRALVRLANKPIGLDCRTAATLCTRSTSSGGANTHSYGGVPVMQAAADMPDEATSLIKQEADKSHGYWFREVLSYEAVKHNFFPHLSDQEVDHLYDKMHPEPITVWTDKLTLSVTSQALPCHYILFTDDVAIRPGYWRDMADKLSSIHPTQVHTLPGHHFGYMEHPEEVIDILDRTLA